MWTKTSRGQIKEKGKESPSSAGFCSFWMGGHTRTMCADRDSCSALDAPRGPGGDPSSVYRIAGNQRPPGRGRAPRNAQADPGREPDLGSAADNMTRVVVSSSDPPAPVPGPERWWEQTFRDCVSSCCGVFLFYDWFSLYSLQSASIKFSPNKKLCAFPPPSASQIGTRPRTCPCPRPPG